MHYIEGINPEEVEKLLLSQKETGVIDVRENNEVEFGMIENAIHIPLERIPYEMNGLSKDTHYIIVCRSGSRSAMAASYLMEHGFKVSNMVGGMLDWQGEIII